MAPALNGLRVSEACRPNVEDLGGSRYQPTLRIVGKGDKPAEIPLNPRTQQAIDQALDGRGDGPLLLDCRGNACNATTPPRSSIASHETSGSSDG
jgi:integrase/recombinase XerD